MISYVEIQREMFFSRSEWSKRIHKPWAARFGLIYMFTIKSHQLLTPNSEVKTRETQLKALATLAVLVSW